MIVLKPIGYVIVNLPDDVVRESIRGVEGFVEVLPEYELALRGLDGFSHVILVAYMHKVTEDKRQVLLVKPRKWVKLGISEDELPEVGVFATDSPHRPNPIAITIVELVEVRGRRLKVRGLDLFNGTPVLDIKPYTYSRRIESIRVPRWYEELMAKIRAIRPDVIEL